MPDLDFSQPGYPARQHAGQQAFEKRRAKRDAKSASAGNASLTVDGEAVDAPKGRAAPKPSKADKLYRKSIRR